MNHTNCYGVVQFASFILQFAPFILQFAKIEMKHPVRSYTRYVDELLRFSEEESRELIQRY